MRVVAHKESWVRAGWTVLRYPSRVIANNPERVGGEVIETVARLSAGR
jgi:very-short-patch-repair endonuclease